MVDVTSSLNPHPRIDLSGVVDAGDIENVRAAAAPLMEQRPTTITVDLSGITAASPRLAAWLLDLAGAVDWVVLRSPSRAVRQLLVLTRIARLFVFA